MSDSETVYMEMKRSELAEFNVDELFYKMKTKYREIREIFSIDSERSFNVYSDTERIAHLSKDMAFLAFEVAERMRYFRAANDMGPGLR